MRTLITWTFVLIAALMPVEGASAKGSDFDTQMMKIYEQYRVIHAALAADRNTDVEKPAQAIAELAKKLDLSKAPAEHAEHYKGLPEKVRAAAETLASASDLEAQRQAFRALSKPMAMWASMDVDSGLNVIYCSMAKGSWLQDDATIKNPYYGSKMLGCGEVVSGPASRKGMKGMTHGSNEHAGHDMSKHSGE